MPTRAVLPNRIYRIGAMLFLDTLVRYYSNWAPRFMDRLEIADIFTTIDNKSIS